MSAAVDALGRRRSRARRPGLRANLAVLHSLLTPAMQGRVIFDFAGYSESSNCADCADMQIGRPSKEGMRGLEVCFDSVNLRSGFAML
jgi:hypothetical protein